MHKLELRTNITGQEPISLSGPVLFAETATGLRGLTRDYTLSARSLKNLTRKARETKLTIKALDRHMLDRCSALFDAAADLGPMTLVMDDQWEARVCIPKTTTSSVKPGLAVQDWTVILLDGCWLKYGRTVHYNVETGDSTGMDLPYDLAAYPGTSVPATGLQVIGLPSGEFGTTRAFQLNALFTPADTTNRRLAWASDNQDVATISDNGLLMLTGKAGTFDLICLSASAQDVFDYRPVSVSYDNQDAGAAQLLAHAVWPDHRTGNAILDADDPSILDVPVRTSDSLWGTHIGISLPNIVKNHTYRITFRYRYKPGAPRSTDGDTMFGVNSSNNVWISSGTRIQYKDLKDDWQDGSITFTAAQPEGVTYNFVDSTSKEHPTVDTTLQLQDFRLLDLTAFGGG